MRFRDDVEVSGPSNYIRFKDGEAVYGILRGDPVEYYELWDQSKNKTIVPAGTHGAKFKFKMNMIIKEGTSYVAKILDAGASIYSQLRALHEEWGDELENTVIVIRRDGSGLDTEYSVNPAPPKQQVTPESLEFIRTIELNDLGEAAQEAPAKPSKPKNHAPGAKF